MFSSSAVIPTKPPNFYVRRCPPRFKLPVRCSSVSVWPKSRQFDLKTYWSTLIHEINQKLDEAISVEYPEQIYEAMRYSVLAKGAKRAPPVMCVAACELFGGNRLAAFPTACALEMVRLLEFFFFGNYYCFGILACLVSYENSLVEILSWLEEFLLGLVD